MKYLELEWVKNEYDYFCLVFKKEKFYCCFGTVHKEKNFWRAFTVCANSKTINYFLHKRYFTKLDAKRAIENHFGIKTIGNKL